MPNGNQEPNQENETDDQEEFVIAKPSGYDATVAQALFEDACSQCHKISKVDEYEMAKPADVLEIVDLMIEEQDLEISDEDKAVVMYYMTERYLGVKSAAVAFEEPADYDAEAAKALYEDTCSQCHKLSKVDEYEFTQQADVLKIVDEMIEEQDLEIEDGDKAVVMYYMAQKFLGGAADSSTGEPDAGTDAGTEEPAEEVERPRRYSATIGKFLYENKCSECHTLDRVNEYDFADFAGVTSLVDEMVTEGLELNDKEKSFLEYYLHQKFVDDN